MTILDDTRDYEAWLAQFTGLQTDDLAFKHALMADANDPFPFFRGTYYRWLRQWSLLCADLNQAPRLMAVGDLHVENFGTWRDREARLVWGVNDFDEVAELPYTNDLVRLACSVRFARDAGPLGIRLGPACEAIMRGYEKTLEKGGCPFVLEEHHPHLRQMAYASDRHPGRFWKRLTRLLHNSKTELPADARAVLLLDLPNKKLECEFRFRPGVGVGSLGKPRYLAITEWAGSKVARDAKAVTPSASAWLAGADKPRPPRIADVVKKAVRCHDPFYRVEKGWIVRRLSPRCSRIELSQLNDVVDQVALLEAMGAETANVHLGSPKKVGPILEDLKLRPPGWLKSAARRMYKALRADWKEYRAAEKVARRSL
jgi:Uncharacterized protein conserved in bacteria (DUF2252)